MEAKHIVATIAISAAVTLALMAVANRYGIPFVDTRPPPTE